LPQGRASQRRRHPSQGRAGPARQTPGCAATRKGPRGALFRTAGLADRAGRLRHCLGRLLYLPGPAGDFGGFRRALHGFLLRGIPHPPGYPFWTIYTWLWTVLVPFKNIAWRVALAEASTAAMACGVLALMVSRGSSMLMEGIEELKKHDRQMGGSHLRRFGHRGRADAGLGQFDVEGIGRHQPHLPLWRAVDAFGAGDADAVELCAAPATLSVHRVFLFSEYARPSTRR